jgi:cytochrome c peroxidase
MPHRWKTTFTLATFLAFLGGCGSETIVHESASSQSFDWNLPKRVYPPRVPSDNPMTEAKVALGRHLFYDTRLSANETQSCSTCHLQQYAFADKNQVGIGSTGEHHTRNPQHLANAGYYTTYTWANPALGTLERQIIIPITGDAPVELGVTEGNEEEVLERFRSDIAYQQMFADAFPGVDNPFRLHYVVKALASFIRTLNSFNSPYDRYLRGEPDALSEAQKRGMALFMGEKAECFHCHDGINFSDSTANEKSFYINQFFHNIGLYNLDGMEGNGAYPLDNQGLYEITMEPADRGKFKAPSLRNVEVTSPYMHDGSMATLEEVIELHSRGGRLIEEGEYAGDGSQNPNRSDLVTAKNFTEQEKSDLVAFLKALTDESFLTDPDLSSPFGEQ